MDVPKFVKTDVWNHINVLADNSGELHLHIQATSKQQLGDRVRMLLIEPEAITSSIVLVKLPFIAKTALKLSLKLPQLQTLILPHPKTADEKRLLKWFMENV